MDPSEMDPQSSSTDGTSDSGHSKVDIDELRRSDRVGQLFVTMMESRGHISDSNIEPLTDALTKLGLDGIRTKVEELFDTHLGKITLQEGYGKFTVDLEEQLSKSLVLKLATLFEFSVAEESALASATDPAHDFVKLMKQKGIISEDSIKMLTDALEENGDKGIAGYIRRGFHKNVQQTQESPEGAQQSVNSKRSDQVQKQLKDMTIRVCGDALSSMHLGNAYNCFTKQRGPSVVFGTVNEVSFSHGETACKRISGSEDIETVLENSSTGEIQIWAKTLAGLGFQNKSSSTHSTCENWFLYSNTYTKKRRWIDGPVPSTDGDYTHYLAEIHYGGYLYIAMPSTEFDEMSAGQYIAGQRGIGKERGATGQISHSLKSNTGNKRERSHVGNSMTTSHLGSLETDGDKSIVEIFENQIKGNEDLVPVKLGFRRLRDHIDCFPVSKQKLGDISSYLDRVRSSLTTSDGSSERGVTMVGDLQRKLKTFVGNVYDGHSITSTSSITTEYDNVRQKFQGLTLKAAAVNVSKLI